MVGDTHGNIHWLRTYIYPVAMAIEAHAVVVLGDFGAWEHTTKGVAFMDDCDEMAAAADIPLYWLHGNHDKWSHTMARYGDNRDAKGFVACRDHVFYIPQGHCWTWAGVSYRSFGGAYSIDKSWRVQAEKMRYQKMLVEARHQVGRGSLFTSDVVPDQTGTLWFPEEEMTDDEMDDLLRQDWYEKDIVLSHDKPLSANPGWDRQNFPACVPNQLRLERALRLHKPDFWFHGHLHYHYVDTVHGDGWGTTVVGLDPDQAAREHESWRRDHTWAVLDTGGGYGASVTLGSHVEVGEGDLLTHKTRLHVAVDH